MNTNYNNNNNNDVAFHMDACNKHQQQLKLTASVIIKKSSSFQRNVFFENYLKNGKCSKPHCLIHSVGNHVICRALLNSGPLNSAQKKSVCNDCLVDFMIKPSARPKTTLDIVLRQLEELSILQKTV